MTRALLIAQSALQTLPVLVLLLIIGSTPVFAHEGAIGNEVMWRACEDRSLNDRCAFRNADHDTYRGSCQSMAGHLVCVRNQPVERAGAADAGHAHVASQQAGIAASEYDWLLGLLAMASIALGGGALASRSGRRGSTNAPLADATCGGAPPVRGSEAP